MIGRVDVPVPVPGAPDPADVVDKGNQLGDALANAGPSVFIIILCLVGALIVMSMLKRPFVRGFLVAAILVSIVIYATK